MTDVIDDVCGADTPNGPCTMKKGHSVEWHRHQVYETIHWVIFNDSRPDGVREKLRTGTGRLGLQYALNDVFGITDEITVNIKNIYNNAA